MRKRKFIIYASAFAAAFAALGFFLMAEAEDPKSVQVKVFKTELMADENASPRTVFQGAAGISVDIVRNAGDAFGNGEVPEGTYKRLKLTVSNEIIYSGQDGYLCGGSPVVGESMLIDDGQAADAEVALYFATAEDGGSTGWTANGSASNPFLLSDAVTVVAGGTTNVNIVFQTADNLTCIAGSPKLSPPTLSVLNYVESSATCDADGQWWFMHYNLSSKVYDDTTGAFITNATVDEAFKRSGVVAGWGTMYFNKNSGEWYIFPGHLYNATAANNPGMAEHRHEFSGWNEAWGEGYLNPAEPSMGDASMVSTYFVSGRDLIMDFGKDGLVKGRISKNCKSFIAVNASRSDTDLIFAVRKPAVPDPAWPSIPAGRKIAVSEYQFEVKYDETDSLGLNALGFTNATETLFLGPGATIIDTGIDGMTHWGSQVQFSPIYNSTDGSIMGWRAAQPKEGTNSEAGVMSVLSIRPDGMMVPPSGSDMDMFVGMNSDGSGVIAGSTIEKDVTWNNHRMSAGVLLDVHPSPAIANLAGTWYMGMLEGDVWAGNDMVWDTGDEMPKYGLTWGTLTVGSDGKASFALSHKDVLTGQVFYNESDVSMGLALAGPVTECYKKNVQNNDIANCGWDANGADGYDGGVTIPIFILTENGMAVARVAIDRTSNLMLFISPMDMNLKPERYTWCDVGLTPGVDCCQSNPLLPNYWTPAALCGDAIPHSMLGFAVKIK